MSRANAIVALAVLAAAPVAGLADVVDSSAGGFTIKITMNVQATPDDVYRKLVQNVGDWWNPEHTYSHDAHNLSIDARPGGCFCEKLPNQGGVHHLGVVLVMPGKALVMQGGLGPLQALATAGSLKIAFAPAGSGTKLEVTYAVAGYLPTGLNSWAAPSNMMLTEQFTRLKNYVEKGSPDPKPASK